MYVSYGRCLVGGQNIGLHAAYRCGDMRGLPCHGIKYNNYLLHLIWMAQSANLHRDIFTLDGYFLICRVHIGNLVLLSIQFQIAIFPVILAGTNWSRHIG